MRDSDDKQRLECSANKSQESEKMAGRREMKKQRKERSDMKVGTFNIDQVLK